MDKSTQKLNQLVQPLLGWYDLNRRHLPWREEVSAYRTWVSEIMLQQTRVTAVIPYFERFLAAFPTVEALANAEEARLLKLWEGLGYYSRARNLQKAAKVIVDTYGGQFPQTYEEIIALPGIGDYTAGAILSIAFRQPIPAVDGNVLRVAARLTGDGRNVLDTKVRKDFRERMAKIMPGEHSGAFNQALMDLGAAVCLPNGTPLCEECPAKDFCDAYETGRQKILPVREKSIAKRVEQKTVFLLRRGDEVALRQRADTGLLAKLWEYPHTEGLLDEVAAATQLADWGITPHNWIKSVRFKHEFTHIRWEMVGYVIEITGIGPTDWVWVRREDRQNYAIPSAFEKLTREWEDTV